MLTVEIHSLEASTAPNVLPSQISRIRDLLDIRLPSWCSSGPSELSGVPPKPSDILAKDDGLGDLYELASHTFTVVNSAIRCRAPIWPFVRGFIKILGTIYCEDATILSRTPFVRPRKTPPADKFDGIAELLVCHVVTGFGETNEKSVSEGAGHPLSHSSTSPKESAESRGEPDDIGEAATQDGSSEEPAEDDPDEIMDPESSQSSDSGPSIDVSLNGHIFPGCGKHTDALLPILCVADAENILDLMTSVACQRFVWEISEPAIGFAISSSGAVMEFVVSWVDKSTRVVHAAHNIGRPGLASFDFTNFSSTLRFSQFILNLSSSIRGVANASSRLCGNNKLSWRSDNPECSIVGEQHVAQWIRDLTLSSSDLQDSFSNCGSISQSTRVPIGLEVSETTGADSLNGATPDGSCSSCSSSHTGSARGSSSSETDEEELAEGYALDRLSRSLFLINHPTTLFKEEGIEINEKVKLYIKMTTFQWFPPSNKDPFPNVVGPLLSHKNALLKQTSEHIHSSHQSQSPLATPLDPQHQLIIQRQIYILLHASAGSQISRTQTEPYEKRNRCDWDTLLFGFYVEKQEIISPTILLERNIHHPRNRLADEADAAKLLVTAQNEAVAHTHYCIRVVLSTSPEYGDASSYSEESSTAYLRWKIFYRSYIDFSAAVDGASQLQGAIQQRSRQEPKDGKCSAICLLTIPSPASIGPADVAALRFTTQVQDGTHNAAAIVVQVNVTMGQSDSCGSQGPMAITDENPEKKTDETAADMGDLDPSIALRNPNAMQHASGKKKSCSSAHSQSDSEGSTDSTCRFWWSPSSTW